ASILSPTPNAPLFPYTTLFRSQHSARHSLGQSTGLIRVQRKHPAGLCETSGRRARLFKSSRSIQWKPCIRRKKRDGHAFYCYDRSEEHTSELQSRGHLVCRLLL